MITVNSGHNQWWTVELDVRPNASVFNWRFNHSDVKAMTVEQASKYTAELVANKFDNLHLLMSGGLDSEFVATILYENRIPFTPVVLNIVGSDNADYFFALHWCQKRNIQPLRITYSVDDMILQQAYAYVCKHYKLTNSTFLFKPLFDFIIAQGGHILNGETNLTMEILGSDWDLPVGDVLEVWPPVLFGSIYTKGQHPCELMAYTPELLLALVKNLDTSLNNASAKAKLYNIPFRPKSWPMKTLHEQTKQKIQKLCKVENYPSFIQKTWARDEFVRLLEKPH